MARGEWGVGSGEWKLHTVGQGEGRGPISDGAGLNRLLLRRLPSRPAGDGSGGDDSRPTPLLPTPYSPIPTLHPQPPLTLRPLRQNPRDLVLQVHAAALELLLDVLGGRFDAGLDAVNGAVQLVVLLGEPREVTVRGLELGDPLALLRK